MPAHIEDLRVIWESKCLVMTPQHVGARRALACKELQAEGITLPSMHDVEQRRAEIEERRFQLWLAEKRFLGFDND